MPSGVPMYRLGEVERVAIEGAIVAAYAEGKTLKVVAKECGWNAKVCSRVLKEHGVEVGRTFTSIQSDKIKRAYLQGESCLKIALHYDVSSSAIVDELRRRQVALRDNSKALSGEQERLIVQMYSEGASLKCIGETVGCAKNTCKKWLVSQGVELRGTFSESELRERNEKIRADFVSGMGCAAVAAKYRVSYHIVRRMLEDAGLRVSKNYFSLEEEQYLIDFYFSNDVDGADTARRFGCNQSLICEIFKRHGLKKKPRSSRLSMKLSAGRQKVPLEEWTGFTVSPWLHFLSSKGYAEWRVSVFRRDGFTCADCKERGGHLEAHHIFRKSLFPHLALETQNGVTLCKKCHKAIKGKEEEHVHRYLLKISSTIAPLIFYQSRQ